MIDRLFIKTNSKKDFISLANLLDSYKDNLKIVAYSNDKFYYVAEVFSKKVIDELYSDTNIFIESDNNYY